MMVPCLLLDKVMVFDCQKDFTLVSELAFDKGTGPRHGIFDRDHQAVLPCQRAEQPGFCVQSDRKRAAGTDSSHNSISLPDFSMKLLQICPILPLDAVYEEPPASAAIRLSPDQRFLYVSTRFAELITVFKISHGRWSKSSKQGAAASIPATWFLRLTAGTCWWQTAPKADWSAFSSTRKQGSFWTYAPAYLRRKLFPLFFPSILFNPYFA